jgi:hypothetical protein
MVPCGTSQAPFDRKRLLIDGLTYTIAGSAARSWMTLNMIRISKPMN